MILDGNTLPYLSRRGRRLLRFLVALLLSLATGPAAGQDPGSPEQPPAGQATPADPDARPLAGAVVDSAGKPVAEADVWLSATTPDERGTVYGRSQTDAQGRFHLTIPGRWFQTGQALRQQLGVIAYKRGYRLAVLGFWHTSTPPVSGARLVLEPPPAATVRVLAPDGKPVANAEVVVTAVACDLIRTGATEEQARELAAQFRTEARATPLGFAVGKSAVRLPEELSRKLTAKTDAQGNATFPAVAHEDSAGIAVTAAAFGTQVSWLHLLALKPAVAEAHKTFQLRPVGRLSGRVVAENPEAVRGLSVIVTSRLNKPTPAGEPARRGRAQVTTDAEGRFEVPALAEGGLQVQVAAPGNAPGQVQVLANRTLTLEAGGHVTVEVPLRRAVRVTGVVRERGTGQPIAGLTVLLRHGEGNLFAEAQTDAAGRYACLVPPGPVYRIPGGRKPFLLPSGDEQQARPEQVPAGAAEHEFPPLELVRAATVRGSVVDDDGRPVAWVSVRAQWTVPHAGGAVGWEYGANDVSVTSDERGAFVLEGLDPAAELRLRARLQDAVTAKATIVRGDLTQLVTLRISKSHALGLSGRVQDAGGQPLAEARIEIWVRPWALPPFTGRPYAVRFDGQPEIRTDAQGRFQTPRQLDRDGQYRAVVRAEGVRTEQTAWLAVAATPTPVFPDLVVQRLRPLEGRVLDRRGKPVAGASVTRADDRDRVRAMTDAEGRFRLTDVPESQGFLFVEKPGFRFHGQPAGPDAGAVEVILAQADEPGARPLKMLAPALPKPERLALARRVLEPVVERALAKGEESDKLRALEVLARLDPARVLEEIEKKHFKESWYNNVLRRAVAQSILEASLDEALTVVVAIDDPFPRAYSYCEVCDALPASERARKLELLGQALVHARNVKEPAQQLVNLGGIAERFLDLGETERATKLLREGQAIAKQLPTAAWAGYARGAFAEALAQIDLPAALELVKDLSDEFEYNRHVENIAHELAGKQPAEAERVLGMLRRPSRRISWLARICYRMAPVNLERARRIADQIEMPDMKAYAYGMMALALAQSQPSRATELLQHAFTLLKTQVESGRDTFNNFYNASSLAGCLLPVAERIDPWLVPEFFWQALALWGGRAEEDEIRASLVDQAETALAPALALYDRALARTLLEPLAQRVSSQPRIYRADSFLVAAVLIDPHWAVKALDHLPDGAEEDRKRQRVARVLTLNGEDYWREVCGQVGVWFADTED